MIAFVMSGGASRGAMEAGALLALFEAGITPDILVGTSAGALNATILATDPTLVGAQRLSRIWSQGKREEMFLGGRVRMISRLMKGLSLFDSSAFRGSMDRWLPKDIRTFGDLTEVKLFVTAANLNSGTLYLYGDSPAASLIDAVMASTAHPLVYPPVRQGSRELVDGGIVANVPVGIAVEKGADEVYIIDVGQPRLGTSGRESVVKRVNQCISMMMYQQFLMDLKYVLDYTDVQLHHIALHGFEDVAMWDSTHSAEMIASGRAATRKYLLDPAAMTEVPLADSSAEPVPEGAHVYVPGLLSPYDLLELPEVARRMATQLARQGQATTSELARILELGQREAEGAARRLVASRQAEILPDGKLNLTFGHRKRRTLPDDLLAGLPEE